MVEKPYCSGRWSKARYFAFIRSALRRASTKWGPRSDILKDNRRKYMGQDKRTKWCYQCNICKSYYKNKDIEVDHIKPVGGLNDLQDLPRFVANLFCETDNLQLLCVNCHQQKTDKDRILS